MPNTKTVTIHYHYAVETADRLQARTLQQLLMDAMTTRDTAVQRDPQPNIGERWRSRAWEEAGNDEILLMNLIHYNESYFYGDLLDFTRNEYQAVIDEETGGETADLSQFEPPEGSSFVRGMLYFTVIGNHVFLIQDKAVRSNRLEDYLNWILRTKTQCLPHDSAFSLNASVSLPEGAAFSDLQEIQVGGLRIDGPESTPPAGDDDDRSPEEPSLPAAASQPTTVREDRIEGSAARRILEDILNDETEVDALVNRVPPGASLEVNVSFSYRENSGKRKKISNQALQGALRHMPYGQITGIGPDGKVLSEDMRLSQKHTLRLYEGLPSEDEVIRACLETYGYFVHHGKISP